MGEKDVYYIAVDDKCFGPYGFGEVVELGILSDTLVSKNGSEWRPAVGYPEFNFLFSNRDFNGTQFCDGLICNNKLLIYKQKREAALIGVLTLGLAGLFVIGPGEVWRSNIFAGTSLGSGGVGFVMKVVSFLIVSIMMAVPFFVVSVFQLIYYTVKLSMLNNR